MCSSEVSERVGWAGPRHHDQQHHRCCFVLLITTLVWCTIARQYWPRVYCLFGPGPLSFLTPKERGHPVREGGGCVCFGPPVASTGWVNQKMGGVPESQLTCLVSMEFGFFSKVNDMCQRPWSMASGKGFGKMPSLRKRLRVQFHHDRISNSFGLPKHLPCYLYFAKQMCVQWMPMPCTILNSCKWCTLMCCSFV